MRLSKIVVSLFIFMSFTASAEAYPLKIANVSAPDINCVFNPQCKVVVSDSVSSFTWPSVVTPPNAAASLQSRTFDAGSGRTAYLYRVIAQKGGSTDCVSGLVIDFGYRIPLDFNKSGQPSDLFVVTKGGLGSTGVKSADINGNIITINFTQAVCNTVTQGSYFFGLVSPNAYKLSTVQAKVYSSAGLQSINVGARIPKH